MAQIMLKYRHTISIYFVQVVFRQCDALVTDLTRDGLKFTRCLGRAGSQELSRVLTITTDNYTPFFHTFLYYSQCMITYSTTRVHVYYMYIHATESQR
jgi:hypothetical protein